MTNSSSRYDNLSASDRFSCADKRAHWLTHGCLVVPSSIVLAGTFIQGQFRNRTEIAMPWQQLLV